METLWRAIQQEIAWDFQSLAELGRITGNGAMVRVANAILGVAAEQGGKPTSLQKIRIHWSKALKPDSQTIGIFDRGELLAAAEAIGCVRY